MIKKNKYDDLSWYEYFKCGRGIKISVIGLSIGFLIIEVLKHISQ